MTNPHIVQARSLFSLQCGVELAIRASAERIWNLLTDAKGFPRWNSTVTSIEGQIREGDRPPAGAGVERGAGWAPAGEAREAPEDRVHLLRASTVSTVLVSPTFARRAQGSSRRSACFSPV